MSGADLSVKQLFFLPFVAICSVLTCGLCAWCSRGSLRSPEVSAGDDQDDDARLEAERKLEELKRRRDDAETEEFERMRQKQQEAEAELEELKKKREERRKVLEEEEKQKKQEEEEKKAREEVEIRFCLLSSWVNSYRRNKITARVDVFFFS